MAKRVALRVELAMRPLVNRCRHCVNLLRFVASESEVYPLQ